jgi:hypothetical protein
MSAVGSKADMALRRILRAYARYHKEISVKDVRHASGPTQFAITRHRTSNVAPSAARRCGSLEIAALGQKQRDLQVRMIPALPPKQTLRARKPMSA